MNNYKTKSEQKILKYIKDFENIFTNKDLDKLISNHNMINKTLSSLEDKNIILRLKKGKYILSEKFYSNPHYFAAILNQGMIGFISALKIHGLIDYEPHKIYVICYKSKKRKIGNFEIIYINLKQKTGLTYINKIPCTDIEKTIVDSLFKPEYSGGFSVIAKAIYQAEINWNKLFEYLERYNKNSLYQKLGYILTLLKDNTDKKIPKSSLKKLKSNIKNNLRLIPNKDLEYEYDSEWKIMDNLGKENILGGIT